MTHFGATILDATGTRLSAEEKRFFADADPFGFILFGRNIESADQVRALCAEMREAVGREAPITIDQEGGRVQRLRAPTWRSWPAPLAQVKAASEHAREVMYLRYRLIAHELRALGIDSNCAPLVDVAGAQTHDFLRDRCYGTDPARVAELGRAVADSLLDGGVLPVLKHIPGHGRAQADSHLDLPVVEADLAALTACDFAPFKALSDLPMGMTAHLVYAAIDALPATISPRMMRLIREEIGFGGLIMTDDISMKALSGSLTDITRASLDAGCDIALLCNASLEDRRAVADAAGRLDAAGQARAEAALAARRMPTEVDISALEAKLSAMSGGDAYGG
ncbi:beta-N-acetylhexosaminidase [Roseovarius nanhaiticus]|uniref:beta-N-acetylhexosaminidase n=1 Tax=Roseovarius nanhaiticus TaxID=573024 RepID=A0A1N7GDE6_9RHOB|nr:beta-N-acetylhexosaminidase [Roseovarius nanhaiticus]SEK30158.1 beta-N-acetylhexosaminidase [Roseovarius nanhaiticus]SIS10496.1 beta-N-acetylhexosaminidase [Roseovarius nanhaiticus]